MQGVNRRGSGWRWGVFLLIAAFVVVIDQISKLWIRSHLLLGESLPEEGILRLTYVQNTGSAFGLFPDQSLTLTIVAIAGLVIILLFYHYLSGSGSMSTLAMGLIFGGAVGNLIDRIRFGYVVDFIDVRLWNEYHWPSFNVADSAITVGTIVLACFIFFVMKEEGEHSAETRS